jgi:hypothetical protein
LSSFPEIDLDKLKEPLLSTISGLIRQYENDPSASFSREECQKFFGHGVSKQLQIEADGGVIVFNDGGKRRIEKRSAYVRLIKLLIASNPVGQPQPKIREVGTRFKKKPRVRTPRELEALKRGNEGRRLAKQARLAAKEAKAEI